MQRLGRKPIAIALAALAIGAAVIFGLRSTAKLRSERTLPDSIQEALTDSIWQRRASAAWGLTRRQDISSSRRATLLMDVLENEIRSPSRGPAVMGTYLPLTSFLRLRYLHALETLGPEARGPVRKAHAKSQDEVREWYTLAMGATLSHDAAPALRPLVLGSSRVEVRMTAARYLGWLRDTSSAPVLKAALKDTATAVLASDVLERQGLRFFPVREQAAKALKTMGFKVTRRGSTYSVQ